MIAYPLRTMRKVQLLDGNWDFVFLGDGIDVESIKPSCIVYDDRMPVPSAFDAYPSYAGKRGTAVYRTKIEVTLGRKSRIHFHGLGMWAGIYVDNQRVGQCSLPYTGFWVDVPPASHRERELVVVVDNRWDARRAPLQEQYYDFYAYGGIFRSVEWHEVPDLSIDRVSVTTLDVKAGVVAVAIKLLGAVPDSLDLRIAFDAGQSVVWKNQKVSDDHIHLEVKMPDPAAWSPRNPRLHTLRVVAGDDDIIERFGLRTVEARNGVICINGEPQKLLGYCRHESHPQFGPALPVQQLVQDLQLLKDLGCNFVRGAHYPQDQRFLDLCDEMGFCVFEESLGWNNDVQHFNNPDFCDAQEEQTTAMVRNSYNHPSVIMWGYLNEGRSDKQESRSLYKRLAECIRREDGTRLVTSASNQPLTDVNYDLFDVVAVNIYPGWYAEDRELVRPLGEIVPYIHKVITHLEKEGLQAKPLVISEIGAAALYGWRDPLNAQWTEQYQSDYLETVCEEVMRNPRISGLAIWLFCDSRTYASSHSLMRPRTFNNKGTLDEYRRPKMAYNTVKRIFRGDNLCGLRARMNA